LNKYEIFRAATLICEGIAALTAILYWPKWKNTGWKWLTIYLVFIFLGELAGRYLRLHPLPFITNPEFYSYIMNPVQYLFLLSFFHRYFKENGKPGWMTGLFMLLYLVVWLVDNLYFQYGRYTWGSFSDSFGDLLLLVVGIRFFYYFIFGDKIIYFKKEMMFWFCTGVLFFYFGSLPLDALRNILAKKYYSIFEVYWFISMGLCCCMYLIFAGSYLWAKPKY